MLRLMEVDKMSGKGLVILVLLLGSLQMGCSRDFVGGAAVGAVGAGAAYEYRTKKQLDQLDRDFEAGRISREEYVKRKKEIKAGSLIY